MSQTTMQVIYEQAKSTRPIHISLDGKTELKNLQTINLYELLLGIAITLGRYAIIYSVREHSQLAADQ